MNIERFGKGALKTPKVIRDKHYRILTAPALIDWNLSYSVENINNFVLPQRDQDGSSSCTAQAACYYCEALEKIEHQKDERYSARFNYSQSVAPGGGAYIWKAMSIPLKIGTVAMNSVPDGDSSEKIMTDQTLNPAALIEARADKYAVIPRSNIDQMAQIVKDYGGFITGFNGRNDMFSPDGTANVFTGMSEWGHAVYVCGYKLHDGRKCLIFKNSWASKWGDGGYGYFPEEFVNSGLMFDCYVYAELTDLDPASVMKFELKQTSGQKDVWLIRNGQRALVYNASALLLVADFGDIKPITQQELDALPDTGKVLASIEQE